MLVHIQRTLAIALQHLSQRHRTPPGALEHGIHALCNVNMFCICGEYSTSGKFVEVCLIHFLSALHSGHSAASRRACTDPRLHKASLMLIY